jgi:hypothetical protein
VPPARSRTGRDAFHLTGAADRFEVAVVAQLDQCRADRRVHDAGSLNRHIESGPQGLEQKWGNNDWDPTALLLHTAQFRVTSEAAACRVDGSELVGQDLQSLVGHGGIGDHDEARRTNGPHRPGGTHRRRAGILGRSDGGHLQQAVGHDWPETVEALDVDEDGDVVVVVVVGATVVVVAPAPADVVSEEDPEVVVVVVGAAVVAVTLEVAAEELVESEATRNPRPTAPVTDAAVTAAVIRRTLIRARSRAAPGDLALERFEGGCDLIGMPFHNAGCSSGGLPWSHLTESDHEQAGGPLSAR